MISNWHCDFSNDGGTPPTLTGEDCFVTATTSEPMATSSLSYKNGFTYGEILIAFFLLLILVLIFFKILIDRSLGVKTQNRDNFN